MCGIVGYIGYEQAGPFLLDGLQTLEYRGYDSAGVCLNDGHKLIVKKAKGKVDDLRNLTHNGADTKGTVGIGHTRWATHGEPSDVNAHPHLSESGRFAVVHNGIIENYQQLKDYLTSKGIVFRSKTDTEVIAQLIEYYYKGDLIDTVIKVLGRLEGSYALGVISQENPDEIIAVRKESPLIIGLGENENYLASDVTAILARTRTIYRLENNEIAILSREGVRIINTDKDEVRKETETVDWDINAAQKGGYEHFMFKEIMEQPKAISDTIAPRIRNGKVVLDEVNLSAEELKKFNKINILACGSAYHVGVVAKYIFEKMLRIPVEADLASEFRYRDPIVNDKTLTIVISQSGETADTKEAMKEAQRRGSHVISIVNVVGSAIATESNDVIYTWAGPEIAVATTKAYSTQLAVIYLLALYFGEMLGTVVPDEYNALVRELEELPDKIDSVLDNKERIQYLASKFFNSKDVFFIGRNIDYALSLEGSLKLKEISYIHSEAYAAGELKHGTISLIENGILVIGVLTQGELLEKTVSNMAECKARGAYLMGVTSNGNYSVEDSVNFTIYVPRTDEHFAGSLAVIPLQLLGYYLSVAKGLDVDKPRNLAKSVTVE